MRQCCEGTYYCNWKCERASFETHKHSCPKIDVKPKKPMPKSDKDEETKCDETNFVKKEHKQSGLGGKENKAYLLAVEPLIKHIQNPFVRFKRGDYLQDRPDTDVYRLLNDAYLILVADRNIHLYLHWGDVPPRAEGVRDFLNDAKAVPGMLPSWWSDKKQAECELGKQKGWGRLAYTVLTVDDQEQRVEQFMDIQLRLLAECIYGNATGFLETHFLRKELMKVPNTSTSEQIGALL